MRQVMPHRNNIVLDVVACKIFLVSLCAFPLFRRRDPCRGARNCHVNVAIRLLRTIAYMRTNRDSANKRCIFGIADMRTARVQPRVFRGLFQ